MDFLDIGASEIAFDREEEVEEVEPVKNVGPEMSYDEFFHSFLVKNKPCIFRPEMSENWSSRREWCSNGAPNFAFLKESFGDSIAPIANCNEKYYNSQPKEEMTIGEYIDYWVDYKNSNYPANKQVLYLKDWHFVKHHPEISIYEVPKFFVSDWLNEYYISRNELQDDYMFVYMGPKGTWTPFHVDVFTSYSWSANVCGKKRWLLFPPGQENHFQDVYGKLIYDVTSDEIHDAGKYKNHDSQRLKCFEIVQEAGEVIFIPSGWHHQVWNLEDTISVNHNWINGCNVRNVWVALRKELEKVMREIEDCRDMSDWSRHCQIMLKASCGMDYIQFFELLDFVAKKRLEFVNNRVPVVNFGKWRQGLNHCVFDLESVKCVLDDIAKDIDEKSIFEICCGDKVSSLSEKIESALKK